MEVKIPELALVVLVVFWRAFKRTPTESIPIGIPIGELAGHGNGHGNGHLKSAEAKSAESGTVTVEVLNQLIRENPNNMTQAIRAWMAGDKEQ